MVLAAHFDRSKHAEFIAREVAEVCRIELVQGDVTRFSAESKNEE